MLDSRIFQNEGLLKVFLWSLLRASYISRWVSVKIGRTITEIQLQPGQFIFGRDSASKQLKMPASTVWKRILKLKNLQKLNIDSNSHYSVITIVNWEAYQNGEEKRNSEGDSRGTAGEQQGNTNKKVIRKLKESNKNTKSKSILKSYPYPDWLNMELWTEFCDQRAKSKHPITSQTGITRLLNSLKKLIDEGHTQEDIIGLALERGWRGFFPPSDFNRSTELSESEKRKREEICRRYGIA